ARGEVMAKDIGRSLQRIPGGAGGASVSFVQRDSVVGPALEELDIRRRRVTKLTKVPPGAEFFAWIPNGIVLTASGTTLYQWDSIRDRKSTRLNSSHVAISYAVFCLKKKKI